MFSRAIIYTALKIVFKRHGSICVNIGPGVDPVNAAVLESLAYPDTKQAEPVEKASARFLSAVIVDQVRNSHEAHYAKNISHNIQSVIDIHEGADDIFYCKARHHVMERRNFHLNRQEFIDICESSVREKAQAPIGMYAGSTSFDELKVSIKIDPANAFRTKQKGFDYVPSVLFQSWSKGERMTESPIGHREQSMVLTSILNAIALSLFTPNCKGFLYNGSAKFTQDSMLHVIFRKGQSPEFHACWENTGNDEAAFVQLEGDSKTECNQGVPAVTGVHIEEFLDSLESFSGAPIRPLSNRRTRPSCRTLMGHLVSIHTEPKDEWDAMLDEALGETRNINELTSQLPTAISKLQRASVYQAIQHPEEQGWF